MTVFIIRSLILMLFTMAVASLLVFVMMEFSPGNVASKTLGPYASDESKAFLAEKLNLNDPVLVRYGRWVGVLSGLMEDPLGNPELELGFDDSRGHQYFGNFGYSTLVQPAFPKYRRYSVRREGDSAIRIMKL